MTARRRPTDSKSVLNALIEMSCSLGSGQSPEEIFTLIINRVKSTFGAEGGTIYIYDPTSHMLKIVLMNNDKLAIDQVVKSFDPLRAKGFIEVPTHNKAGELNVKSIPICSFFQKRKILVRDIRACDEFDFSRTYAFDKQHNYHTKNLMVLPLRGRNDEVIGVLQIINSDEFAFADEIQRLLDAMTGQVSSLLHNALLTTETKNLLTAFIEMISAAIDEKSPHTAGHCARVTELTMMIAQEMNDSSDGIYADFHLNKEQMNELKTAALLHDVGKVVTPAHVMEKPTKMYGLADRFELVKSRLEHWRLAQRMEKLEAAVRGIGREDLLAQSEQSEADIAAEAEFIDRVNHCLEPVDEKIESQVQQIAERKIQNGGAQPTPVLDGQMRENLLVRRGTLNPAERKIMEDHVSISVRLLSSIPWPSHLQNIIEYAGAHHEMMSGKGYPNGITGEQMSLPARILGLSDRFEAISAHDRPYRTAKNTLSKVMKIMQFMSNDNEIDQEMFQFFKDRKIYKTYADRFMPPELIDCD